jgi:hypothetical protein
MKASSVTVELLKGIRSDMRGMRGDLHGVREEIQGVREEIQGVREELSHRIDHLTHRVVESELRTATAMTDLAGTVREMTAVLRVQSDLRPRVEKCEEDIASMKKRLPAA